MSVLIENNVLSVTNFTTDDSGIVSYFEEIDPDNTEKRFELALKVGTMALKTISTTERIDYIEKEFFKLQEKYEKTLSNTVKDLEKEFANSIGENGVFKKTLEKYLDENGRIDKIFEDNLGKSGVLTTRIEEQFGPRGQLVKEILDPMVEGTPLYSLRTSIEEKIAQIRIDIGISERDKEALEGAPQKGFVFEDYCEPILEQIVNKHLGYSVERTSDSKGLVTNSNKGDFVVSISEIPDTRIVLEMKDTGISLPAIKRELDGAMENRDAKYGILVAKWKEDLPNSVGCFNEYDGKYLVCALSSRDHDGEIHPEFLNTALSWARNRILLKSTDSDDMDIPLVRIKMDEIKAKLDRFSQLRIQCTNAEEAIAGVRKYAAEIQNGIKEELNAIYIEINKG